MIKSEELADPKSCLNQAAADEPIFVFRANDELAPNKVREWAQEYHDLKCAASPTNTLTTAQVAKYRHALAFADTMDRWRIAHAAAISAPAGQGDPAKQSAN